MDETTIDKRLERIARSLDKDQIAVIVYLADHGESSIEEIQKGTGIDAKTIKLILTGLP